VATGKLPFTNEFVANYANPVNYSCLNFYQFYNPKECNPSWELSISINFRVLEYWSVGVMTKGLMSFFPTLHHSSTPGPRLSRTFGNL